ncbi:MAG: hypothetical protein J5649_03990 [Lachnospiraceae bacterium]|nr:hypothetical protein [Lachnospiraceae bacterium]
MKKQWLIPLLCICLLCAALGGAYAAGIIGSPEPEPVVTEGRYYRGEAIAGAMLQLIDSRGVVIREWKTDTEAYLIEAELTAGETYILHEAEAPSGYLPAEDITFTVPPDGSLADIVMEDAPTEISFTKKDRDTGKPVYDAVLQVLDENGAVIDEWTTDGSIHLIRGVLQAGKTYTLHEKRTPAGYETAGDETFTVPENEGTYEVVFYNVKAEDDIPKTGDRLPLTLLVGITAVAIIGVCATLWFKKKQ